MYVRISPDNKLWQVEEGSNDLTVTNLSNNQIVATLRGIRDKPYNFEQYRSMRFAKEDQIPIWRKGGQSLEAINGVTCQPQYQFKEFWPVGQIPMRLCTNSQMSKIFGYSLSENEGVITIADYARASNYQTKNIRVPKNEKWVGLEMTTSGSLLIVANSFMQMNNQAGTNESWLRMMAIDASNNTISIVSQQDFKEPIFRSTQLCRKIKGYDFFVVCCGGSVGIIAYHNQRFILLQTILNIYNNRIIDLAFYKNYLIPIAQSAGETVKVIEFNA